MHWKNCKKINVANTTNTLWDVYENEFDGVLQQTDDCGVNFYKNAKNALLTK